MKIWFENGMFFYKLFYIKSIQSSVTMGATLISGFRLYIQNMYIRTQVNSVQENKLNV